MPFVAWLVVAIVAQFASAFLMPRAKQEKQKPSTLSDFDFPQFKEGTPQDVVFGDCWTDSWFVLFFGNLRSKAIKSKGGKK